MNNRNKIKLDKQKVCELVTHHLGASAKGEVTELTEGMFNTAFAVNCEGRKPVVIKIAPPPSAEYLTYEQNIMRTEVEFYRRARTKWPLPGLLAVDFTRQLIESDFFIIEKLDGRSVHSLWLNSKEKKQVRRELGIIVAKLRDVHGVEFGYLQPETGIAASTWREAFALMVDKVLQDAKRLSVSLPMSSDEISSLVLKHEWCLNEVTKPTLVHFDLWNGNIFIRPKKERTSEGPLIEGIIDGERAFWGDHYAEFVSAALLQDIESDKDFLQAYAQEAGQEIVFTPGLRTRIKLYEMYLFIIMLAEGVPRGYSGPTNFALNQFIRYKLRKVFKFLVNNKSKG